jgi:signal peptidase I
VVRRKVRRVAIVAAGVVLAVVAWAFLGPVALGGPASYVVTDGVSMLPHFKADGLVITHERDSYHVGEIVAYHNHYLHTVVMHRIVALDGERYVFKGDNNSSPDGYHATRADLIGEEWLYWPGGGGLLKKVRQPVAFAVIIGLLGLFAAQGFAPRRSRRRTRHHGK